MAKISLITPLVLTSVLAAQGLTPQDGEETPVVNDRGLLHLRFGSFDPVFDHPNLPDGLRSAPGDELYILQFAGRANEPARQAVEALGARLVQYLPDSAYAVRMDAATAVAAQQLEAVRYVGPYHPGLRMDSDMVAGVLEGGPRPSGRYTLVVDSAAKASLIAAIPQAGGELAYGGDGPGIRVDAFLTFEGAVQLAGHDAALWIEPWERIERTMSNARIQGGADAIASQGGYEGLGVNGHIFEGVDVLHGDLQANADRSGPVVVGGGSAPFPDRHGHCTFGIIFGDGSGSASAKGMMPRAQGFYSNFGVLNTTSRFNLIATARNTHQVMFSSASWVNGFSQNYNTFAAELDDIAFRLSMPMTNSMGNSGDRNAGRQAWAKNILSIGGVIHRNNSSSGDDFWGGSGSIGPASDGRIKPDLVGYYESVRTTDMESAAGQGYVAGSAYTNSFGGTSAACPLVAGHLGLQIEMFADGAFGNVPAVFGGTVFQNRPKPSTSKAHMINTARQYNFTGSGVDLTRVHQGWGFPDLAKMWQLRENTLIVNEDDILVEGESVTYNMFVPGDTALRATLTWMDPPASPGATFAQINDLDLKLTAPDGTIYWGNNGLLTAINSSSGGSADRIDTVENVILNSPAAGNWTVEVIAHDVNQDGHPEDGTRNVDFALVVTGGEGFGCDGTLDLAGEGCPDVFGRPVEMTWDGCFSVGETVNVGAITIVPPGSFQFLAIGDSNTDWNGVPLPLDLGIIGSPGCVIYNDHDQIRAVPYDIQGGSLDLTIPEDTGLVGETFYLQGIVFEPVAGRFITSNQLGVTIGG